MLSMSPWKDFPNRHCSNIFISCNTYNATLVCSVMIGGFLWGCSVIVTTQKKQAFTVYLLATQLPEGEGQDQNQIVRQLSTTNWLPVPTAPSQGSYNSSYRRPFTRNTKHSSMKHYQMVRRWSICNTGHTRIWYALHFLFPSAPRYIPPLGTIWLMPSSWHQTQVSGWWSSLFSHIIHVPNKLKKTKWQMTKKTSLQYLLRSFYRQPLLETAVIAELGVDGSTIKHLLVPWWGVGNYHPGLH